MAEKTPIPVDILFEIFLRLPAKSIVRFICVSKLWAIIIRDQDFIRAFSFHSSPHKQPRLLFAFNNLINRYQEDWYFFSESSTHVDFVSRTVCHENKLRQNKPSHVHGLISLLYGEEQVIINPSIDKSITLPIAKSNELIIKSFLGYDQIDAQHKVLCLTLVGLFCEHQVLTLGSNSWRMIQCSIPSHFPGHNCVCIDGFLYYSACAFTMKEPFLVRFDVRSENFEIASVFPEEVKSMNHTTLINYNGKVAFVTQRMNVYVNSYDLDLWVLEDAKKQEWSKEHLTLDICFTDGSFQGVYDMGDIIFAPNRSEDLYVYFMDHKSPRIRRVEMEGNIKYKFRNFYNVFTFLHYVESVMFI